MTVIDFPTTHQVPDDWLTSAEFCDRTGITFRQADYWVRTGYLHEIPRPPDVGSGTPRYFPPSEVGVARLVRRLTDAGVLPRQAFTVARELVDHGHALLGGIRIDLPQDL